ncbi:hypothetical protein NP493_843g01053 [Ridgeia piscesae]|uniref:AEBP2-like C-terminal SH3 domain-containing protein n=1 Tax=Ridgeia piscesae TaxID=27915 RepID=A0AAD9KMK0_RIDPI|nr:hypothetical protein NP493_843g01053 [Ridgeia piscesae]
MQGWVGMTRQRSYLSTVISSVSNQLVTGPPKWLLGASLPHPKKPQVIARRTDKTGDSWCLLHWNPENILPDSWVTERTVETQHKRIIPLTDLPQQSMLTLHPSFYSTHRYRKHRRK